MTDLLNLPGFPVEQVIEDEHQYSIKVGRRRTRAHCPHCGSLALKPNGSREVRIHDLPIHGKRVGIWFDRQRFLCPDCGKSCSDEPEALDPARQMTVPEETIGPALADLAGIIDDIEHGVDDQP